MGFWRLPRSTRTRRALAQVHLWTGIAVGLYLLTLSLTGALLMFRIDLQRSAHPELLQPSRVGPPVPIERVLDELARAWPGYRIAGADAPTDRRPVYLAYVSRGDEFQTVLLDPVDGRVLGTLPEASWVRTLQNLHFDLLAGRTGRRVNGAGAGLLLLLVLTGGVIWWQGAGRWRRGLKVDLSQSALRINWDLHGATGFWTLLLLSMWALTGLYFAFPQSFRATVDALSPLTQMARPSLPRTVEPGASLSRDELLARARAAMPGQPIARVVLPATTHDPMQVLFAPQSPTPVAATLVPLFLDPASGAVLQAPRRQRSVGDVVMDWVGPLHTGNFGGVFVRVLWCLFGLAPALLFITGFVSWWTRVVRPRTPAQLS